MIGRTAAQTVYKALLENPRIPVVIAVGPAGTGKTIMAATAAAKFAKKLILTRPTVAADEDIGFLPGSLEDKMIPWIKPITDVLPARTKYEVCPLAYMRGLTFNDAWIIADEMQNSSKNQMKMLLTRVGAGSKLIITGDLDQREDPEFTGLNDIVARILGIGSPLIQMVQFTENDVVRSDVVNDALRLYRT
jgi:phosphate starvation-inducible protein PhoH and related proteins